MASKFHRYLKYARKKHRAKSSLKFNRYARLYWRYHFQMYGDHVNLWELP